MLKRKIQSEEGRERVKKSSTREELDNIPLLTVESAKRTYRRICDRAGTMNQVQTVFNADSLSVVQYRSGMVSCTKCMKRDCAHVNFLLDRGCFNTLHYVDAMERRGFWKVPLRKEDKQKVKHVGKKSKSVKVTF